MIFPMKLWGLQHISNQQSINFCNTFCRSTWKTNMGSDCVAYMRQNLFLILSWTWMNNEVNSISSSIKLVVSKRDNSFCILWISSYIERILKSLSTMRIAYNFAIGQNGKGFVPPYLNFLISSFSWLFASI